MECLRWNIWFSSVGWVKQAVRTHSLCTIYVNVPPPSVSSVWESLELVLHLHLSCSSPTVSCSYPLISHNMSFFIPKCLCCIGTSVYCVKFNCPLKVLLLNAQSYVGKGHNILSTCNWACQKYVTVSIVFYNFGHCSYDFDCLANRDIKECLLGGGGL